MQISWTPSRNPEQTGKSVFRFRTCCTNETIVNYVNMSIVDVTTYDGA